MAHHRPISTILALALTLALAGPSVYGDRAVRFNAEGNRLYREGAYDEAIHQYNRAHIEAPDEQTIDYNIGTTQARLGRDDAAREAFARIDPRDHPELYALSRYNLGILHYRDAQRQIAMQQYREALETLRQAMDVNRDALRADRSLDDARFNYEVIKQRYDELLEMLEDMPPQEQDPDEPSQSDDSDPSGAGDSEGDEETDSESSPSDPQPGDDESEPDQPAGDDDRDDPQPPEDEDQADSQAGDGDTDTDRPSASGETAPEDQEIQLSPEDARALLNALADEDRSALQRLLRTQVGPPMENAW